MKRSAGYLFVMYFVTLLVIHEVMQSKANEAEKFGELYAVTIINEHEVQLTNSNDTIKLFFENSYVLCDETIVYINK